MTMERGDDAAIGGVRFLGRRRDYWRLLVRGAGLLILTLGLYRFWLATDIRRFLWSNSEIDGETLEYAGTPLELLIGFLAAIALLVPIYAAFFVAALDLGVLGRLSGLAAVAALGLLGQYAVYRARRYRLTRTIFRGLRFHQEGSAWGYAFRAAAWWIATVATIGLAYPFQLASLERYKMRHTFYGDLAGRFEGAGWRLLLKGLPMWLLVVGPLVLAAFAALDTVDWRALDDAVNGGGGDLMGRIEGGNPGFGGAIVFALLMAGASVTAAALLYPAFQAVCLRWWSSGLRFGPITLRSKLRIRQIYAAYLRFLWYAILFGLAVALLAIPVVAIVAALAGGDRPSTAAAIAATAIMLAGYAVTALGYSTIYRATVLLSLWQLGMESLQVSGLAALDTVKAGGRPSSALGEGLADALHMGGL